MGNFGDPIVSEREMFICKEGKKDRVDQRLRGKGGGNLGVGIPLTTCASYKPDSMTANAVLIL